MPGKNSNSQGSNDTPLKTVAGHNENFSQVDGFLVKKTNKTEARFYEPLMRQEYELCKFAPECKKIEFAEPSDASSAKVVLEDLRLGFISPLIYDIKIGTHNISINELKVSGLKRKNIIRKYIRLNIADSVSSSKKLGYRFAGSSNSHKSKKYLAIHPQEMINDMVTKINKADIIAIINELEKILCYLKSSEGCRFEMIGASLLILVENDPNSLDRDSRQTPKVKIIDFAHSNIIREKAVMLSNGMGETPHRKAKYQEGVCFGVENLIGSLKKASMLTPV